MVSVVVVAYPAFSLFRRGTKLNTRCLYVYDFSGFEAALAVGNLYVFM